MVDKSKFLCHPSKFSRNSVEKSLVFKRKYHEKRASQTVIDEKLLCHENCSRLSEQGEHLRLELFFGENLNRRKIRISISKKYFYSFWSLSNEHFKVFCLIQNYDHYKNVELSFPTSWDFKTEFFSPWESIPA